MNGAIATEKERSAALHIPLQSTLATFLGIVILTGFSLLLAQTSLAAAAGYSVERLEQTKALKERQNRELAGEVGSLRSLNRVEWEAMEYLKMVPATSYIYVTVDTLPAEPPALLKKSLEAEQPVQPQAPTSPWWERLLLDTFNQGGSDAFP